jgi:ribosome-interacting GTPase 1
MADVQAKIAELEAEMARTQKNKATKYVGVRDAAFAGVSQNGPGAQTIT